MSGFTALAAIQSFFVGLQLQTALQKHRQDFELHLIDAARRKREEWAKETLRSGSGETAWI